jgi:hypothetical protein
MGSTLQPRQRHSARFEVSRDRTSVDSICRATRMRFIVDVASTEKRLVAKARLS